MSGDLAIPLRGRRGDDAFDEIEDALSSGVVGIGDVVGDGGVVAVGDFFGADLSVFGAGENGGEIGVLFRAGGGVVFGPEDVGGRDAF